MGDVRVMVSLIYDGDCPFCTRYVELVRLRENFEVQLKNAREEPELQISMRQLGLDLDEGMVLEIDGEHFHGADCVHRIALLTSPSSFFNRVNSWVFRQPRLSTIIYPVLVFLRNLVLKLLGRGKING